MAEEKTPRAGKKAVLAALLLLLFCAAAWGLLLNGHRSEVAGLEERKVAAAEKFDKQIYDEALVDYKACLEAAPNDLECMSRVAEIYHLTGQDNSCIAWCERVLRQDPNDLKTRLYEARSYDNKKNVRSAISVLQKAGENDGTEAQRTERAEYLRELKGRYELTYFSFRNVCPWFRLPDGTPCATVVEDETLAVCSAAGKEQLSGAWGFLGASADDDLLFPVREQDQWFFVDGNGERRLVPNGTYTSLHSFSEGLAPASRKSSADPSAPVVAGYLDKTLQELRFDFQETYPLTGGHALARKDGTYFVLDASLQEVTACEFTAVKTDPYGNAQKYGMILGRLPGDPEQWAMYAPNGIRVNDFSADDLRLPEAQKSPLAFCRDGLWGFVSLDGTVLLEPQFEDATSFSKGMAAVKKDGKWGYIDRTGAFLIPPTFEEAGPLSPSGSAFVKNHAGYSLMTLSRYAKNAS